MFATWFRIKILMGFIITWSIIQMGISSWLTESSGGDFASIHSNSPNITIADYSQWTTSVCATSPYIYVEPFSFTYTYNGNSYGNAAYCGFPRSNSVLRIFTAIVTSLLLGLFFIETPVSAIGRTLQMCLACLYFASFVLDADAVATGTGTCQSTFLNTHLYDDMMKLGVTVTCNMSNYAGVAVINLMLTILLLLLQAAWSNCTDMYSGVPTATNSV